MPNSRLPDGSYLAEIKGKIQDIKNSTEKQNKWRKETIVVRVIEYQIPGFRPCRLITSCKKLQTETLQTANKSKLKPH